MGWIRPENWPLFGFILGGWCLLVGRTWQCESTDFLCICVVGLHVLQSPWSSSVQAVHTEVQKTSTAALTTWYTYWLATNARNNISAKREDRLSKGGKNTYMTSKWNDPTRSLHISTKMTITRRPHSMPKFWAWSMGLQNVQPNDANTKKVGGFALSSPSNQKASTSENKANFPDESIPSNYHHFQNLKDTPSVPPYKNSLDLLVLGNMCEHSSQILERLDKNWWSLFDLKKKSWWTMHRQWMDGWLSIR